MCIRDRTYSGSTDNVTLGDLDGDGHLDVLVAEDGARAVSYWRGAGDGSLEEQRRYGAGRPATSVAAGDFTGDGRADLMALVEPQGFANWYYPAVSLLAGVPAPWTDLGQGLFGTHGVPSLAGAGPATPGANAQLGLAGALEGAPAFLVGGLAQVDLPLLGGVLVPSGEFVVALTADAAGAIELPFQWPASQASGFQLLFQTWILDPGAPQTFAASNAVRAVQP